MINMENIVAQNGYLVNGATGEKIIWYECDPAKNTECAHKICRAASKEDHDFGFCSKTANPAFRKDGSKAWYAVMKSAEGSEPYWGREYIEGV